MVAVSGEHSQDTLPRTSISKQKGAKKRVAVISVDEDGLAAEEDSSPAQKRAKGKGEGLSHLLWDVLNEQKNISLGKPKMVCETSSLSISFSIHFRHRKLFSTSPERSLPRLRQRSLRNLPKV